MDTKKKNQGQSASTASKPVMKKAATPPPIAPVSVAHRLVALPVKGDAFLLVRGGKPVLVDGGGNGADLYRELRAEFPDGIHIGRIICTHNDADHANGIAQLLDDEINYPLSVDEVWLPGSWADPIEQLTKGGDAILYNLLLGVETCKSKLSGDRSSLSPLKQLFEAVISDQGDVDTFHPHMPDKKEGNVKESAEPKQASGALYQAVMLTLKSDTNLQGGRLSCLNNKLTQKAISQGGITTAGTRLEQKIAGSLIQYLMEAGERIHKIATAAVKRGAIIRWFDADEYYRDWPRKASGGDPDLVPLNSKELLTLPDSELDIGDLLFLTTVNRHSLVFWAPEKDNMPGCIFSADGLLDGDVLSSVPQRVTAVTAPHHGSATNAPDAYINLEKVIGKVLWEEHTILVRSDRYVQKNPCKEFKSTPLRLCTVCPNNSYEHQKLTLNVSSGSFDWDFGAASALRGCTGL